MRIKNIRTVLSRSRLLSVLVLAIYIAGAVTPNVSAVSNEQREIDRDGIKLLAAAEENAALCGSNSGSTTLRGRDNKEKAFNYFKDHGLSEAQAAGIVGNLDAESGVDPTAVQPSGYGHGIAQWETVIKGKGSGRWDVRPPIDDKPANVKDFAASPAGGGRPMIDLGLQLDYLWHELTYFYSSSLKKIQAATSEGEAAIIFMIEVEAPAERSPTGPNARDRAERAAEILSEYGSGSTAGSGTGSNPCGSQGGGTIVERALGFAWPQPFRDRPDDQRQIRRFPTTPTTAYVGGVRQFNRSQRDYTDCGVFVATVMRASGADPDYPPVSTSTQYAYLTSHPEKYFIDPNPTQDKLQPGDILIITRGQRGTTSGHTWIYVGPQTGGYTSASASLGGRAPNLGYEEFDGYTLARRLQ